MTEYFIRFGGSDGAAGTFGAPFLTIAHALSVATTPGDIVTIDDSRTYTQASEGTTGQNNYVVLMSHSGTQGNPITLRASSGNLPCIDSGSVAFACIAGFADWVTIGPNLDIYGRGDEVD